MKIDEALLQRLENLSHLKIADAKRQEIIGQLSEFLEFAENLKELDTEGVDATFNMRDTKTHLRSDTSSSSKTVSDDILSHAPQSSDNFFIVPSIIE